MEKFLKWTVLFIVLIILASGGVAFYSVFITDRDMMTMPSFREMSLMNAVTDAEQLGLKVRIEQIESKLPTGRVLAQWPEPGTKIRGTEKNVILKISKSGERQPIPDIRGIDLSRATRMLQEQGFTVGDVIRIKDSRNSGLPAGAVIAQSPASPGSIPVNYKVDLLVSEGSEDGRIAVPDVAQLTESRAKETLENAGLKIASVEKSNNRNVIEGLVINTRPVAGTMVKKGEGIRVLISAGERDAPANTANTPGTPGTPGAPKSADPPSIPGRPREPILTDVSMLDQPGRPQLVSPEIPQRSDTTGARQDDPHSPEFRLPTGGPVSPSVTPPPAPATGNKVAKIRYQVPPILRPLPLRIEIVDLRGKRVLLERNARANETVQLDGSYFQEAVVSIFLGGDSVWQERFK